MRDTTKKSPRLVLVTVTSALGQSSLYNRLKLVQGKKQLVEYKKIGETRGFGHFQISSELFERLRNLLAQEGHAYANGHQFGDGPNWRLRVTRVGLKRLGLNDELVHHGIKREVYACPLADNFKECLQGETDEPIFGLNSVEEISKAAIQRWVLPRSFRQTGWKNFVNEQIMEQFPDSVEE